jgi:hypothetical protein
MRGTFKNFNAEATEATDEEKTWPRYAVNLLSSATSEISVLKILRASMQGFSPRKKIG